MAEGISLMIVVVKSVNITVPGFICVSSNFSTYCLMSPVTVPIVCTTVTIVCATRDFLFATLPCYGSMTYFLQSPKIT